MRKIHEILRDLTSIKTSALYSQRKVLNEAADILEKIEKVGTNGANGIEIPIYREKDTGTMGNTDTMALLTRMVNELKAENEMLKSQIFTKKYETATSSLGKKISDIEAGKVVER